MKKIVVLICFVFTVSVINAQDITSFMEVPVENGKVVFSDTIQTLLSDEQIHTRLQSWYEEYLKEDDERTGELRLNDPTLKAMDCRFMDHMVMEKRALMIYSIYMRYSVRVIYGDNKCVVRVNRISYIEPEDMKGKDRNNPLISAEDILLKRKYKVILVENPVEKIENHTFLTIERLFNSIKRNLN